RPPNGPRLRLVRPTPRRDEARHASPPRGVGRRQEAGEGPREEEPDGIGGGRVDPTGIQRDARGGRRGGRDVRPVVLGGRLDVRRSRRRRGRGGGGLPPSPGGRAAMFAGTNPFDSSEDLSARGDGEASPATVTTYVLRGGGFDLPSLSSAAASSAAGRDGGRLFRFLFAPRLTELERAYLAELGVEHDVAEGRPGRAGVVNSLEDLGVDLVSLDDDVWSLELGG
ncbi:hypothetical protein THAOC_15367, partial [Thalassiosira oceanica]